MFLEEAWTQFREREAAWDRVEQVLLGAGGRVSGELRGEIHGLGETLEGQRGSQCQVPGSREQMVSCALAGGGSR